MRGVEPCSKFTLSLKLPLSGGVVSRLMEIDHQIMQKEKRYPVSFDTTNDARLQPLQYVRVIVNAGNLTVC